MINRKELKNHYGDDLSIVSDLIEIFNESYQDSLDDIEKSLNDDNLKNLELHAHNLKGMISNFFCKSIKEACFELEKMGSNKKLDDPLSHFSFIENNIPLMIKDLKKEIEI